VEYLSDQLYYFMYYVCHKTRGPQKLNKLRKNVFFTFYTIIGVFELRSTRLNLTFFQMNSNFPTLRNKDNIITMSIIFSKL